MAGFEKSNFSKEVTEEMTNPQLDAFLETLALLIEAKATTIAEAAEIVRNAKTTA